MYVLLATDGRPSASAAAGLLTRLADPRRIEVAILSAPDPRVETPDHYVQELLDATGHVLTEAGLSCRSIRRDEEPASAVEKEATGDTYGVVVLGAGNHTWGGEIVLGSVTSHVLRTVPVPILLVHRRPHRPGDPLRVLVGADGSPAASHAIDTLMRLTEPARVDISVRTVTRAPEMVIRGHASVSGGAAMATPEAEVDLAAARLERALERLRAAGFHPRGSIGLGWPAIDLTARAEEEDADLVVVGARGLGTTDQLSLGSVSAHVARHTAATLVAPPEIDSPEELGG